MHFVYFIFVVNFQNLVKKHELLGVNENLPDKVEFLLMALV